MELTFHWRERRNANACSLKAGSAEYYANPLKEEQRDCRAAVLGGLVKEEHRQEGSERASSACICGKALKTTGRATTKALIWSSDRKT